MLNDCVCRKCSLQATHRRLQAEVEKLTSPSLHSSTQTLSNGHLSIEVEDDQDVSPDPGSLSISKKRRIREAKKWEGRVGAALAEGRIEEDLGRVLEAKVEKVISRASTKQVMIARVSQTSPSHVCNLIIRPFYRF